MLTKPSIKKLEKLKYYIFFQWVEELKNSKIKKTEIKKTEDKLRILDLFTC